MIFKNTEHRISKIYQNIVEISRSKFFYIDFELDDSFETRFDLIIFHAFMIFYFYKSKNIKNSSLSQMLFDYMFNDFENNLREMGFGDIAVNKKMKLLSKFDSNFFSNNHSIDQLILEYLDGQIWFSEISKTNERFEFLSIINSLDDNNFFLDKSKIKYTIITRGGGFQQKGCKSPIN